MNIFISASDADHKLIHLVSLWLGFPGLFSFRDS